MSHHIPKADPASTFLPPTPNLLADQNLPADPTSIPAPFFKPSEPTLQPIAKGSFSGDLNPFSQPENSLTGRPVGGNLMGPNHFPFANPRSDGQAPNSVKPKFDPFGPISGMGKLNSD